jgi:hypothetical protein
MKPYNNLVATSDYIIREFDEDIDPIELMWHRDEEDRLVEALDTTDWMIQLDNSLPLLFSKPIFIPKYSWHRVIKGHKKLKVKIHKL